MSLCSNFISALIFFQEFIMRNFITHKLLFISLKIRLCFTVDGLLSPESFIP